MVTAPGAPSPSPSWARPDRQARSGGPRRGELLAIAGQVGWDQDERIVSDDFVEQFAQALRNVMSVLETAGGRAEDLVCMTIYVGDKREYLSCSRELSRLWVEIVGRHYPAISLAEVADFIEEGAKLEIQALAVLPP